MLVLGAAGAGCFGGPGYDGPPSEHFDGERFRNEIETPHSSFFHFLRWRFTRDPGPWDEVEGAEPGPPPPARVGDGRLRVTFVNHATTLVQVEGINVLTDPIWSERTSPVSWAGPARVRPPGIRFEDLPPIDAVLVSHDHYDHLDVPTLARLAAAHSPRILVGLGNAALLAEEGIEGVTELDWWDEVRLERGPPITFVPTRHFSGRGLGDRDTTLWGGWVIGAASGSVYYAGDTGWGPHFATIGERLGPVRLAILPIGAYLPRWFMQAIHVSPAEAVQAHLDLGAGTSLGVHFGTFPLGDDGRDQAPTELAAARAALGLDDDDFWVLEFGEGRDVPPLGPGPADAGPATGETP